MPSTATDHFRLLVIANETVTTRILRDTIVGIAGGRPAEVTVVAPALNGRLRHWCSDEDEAREAAQGRLERALDGLGAHGLRVSGWVGDADPVMAIDDALRNGDADELLIATHPEQRSNWLARDLVERAVSRFGLPTAHLVAAEDAVMPAEAREPLAAAA